jgi:hypothetical protein
MVPGFCPAQDHEAALQANDSQDGEDTSQDDKDTSQDDEDTLCDHERILQVDEVAGGGPGKACQDRFRKLGLI